MFKLKLISIVSTIVLLVSYFSVSEEQLFSSYIGVVMILIYLTSFISSFYIILIYGSKKINKGQKHRENIFGIVIMLDSLMFLVLTLYFADFFFNVPTINVFIVIGALLFVLLYFILAYIFDYVVVEDDGLTISYFMSLKSTHVKYEHIQSISFGVLMNNFRIKTSNKTHFIDVSLINADEVLNNLSQNTSPEVHKDAFISLGKYFRFFRLKCNIDKLNYFKEKNDIN